MITLVTSPVGGSGVSITSVLLALWLRETSDRVRIVDLSPHPEHSPLGKLGPIPRLDVIYASDASPSSDEAPAERRFAAAWLRAQRAMEHVDSSVSTVVDLPFVFASWAWRDIRGWLQQSNSSIRVMLLLPSTARSVRCLDAMPDNIAGGLILAYPEWILGTPRILSESASRERLLQANARQVVIPSLAWGTVADKLSHGLVPVGRDGAASMLGRMQLRSALERLATNVGKVWPSNIAHAPVDFGLQWSQETIPVAR